MSNLVERLRVWSRSEWGYSLPGMALTEAADRIERLESALRDIMALDGEINPSNYDHDDACYLNTQFVYSYTIAKAALEALEQPKNLQTS